MWLDSVGEPIGLNVRDEREIKSKEFIQKNNVLVAKATYDEDMKVSTSLLMGFSTWTNLHTLLHLLTK